MAPTLFPAVALPVPLHLVKDTHESDAVSSALHAKILSPDQVTVYDVDAGGDSETALPEPFPQATTTADDRRFPLVLLFPSKDSQVIEFADLPDDWPSYGSVAVVDGTWRRAKRMVVVPRALLVHSL